MGPLRDRLSAQSHRQSLRLKTAQAHYEALLEETKKRGGPNKYSFKDFPAAEWNGEYAGPFQDRPGQETWYWGFHNQIPTILSILTPEYQQRMVQEAYHHVRAHPLWPATFCWPEGFMRRFFYPAVREHYVLVTPDVFQITTGVARNFITRVHVGRQFNMDDVAKGGVPGWAPRCLAGTARPSVSGTRTP